jgi:hypothetical protein
MNRGVCSLAVAEAADVVAPQGEPVAVPGARLEPAPQAPRLHCQRVTPIA